MRKDLVQIVCCPVHKNPLKLTIQAEDEQGDVIAGSLHCARCKFDYPIEEGIPNLLPPEYHIDEVAEARPKDGSRQPSASATPSRASGKRKTQ